ncbi:hypothetical protein GOBAR_DD23513 [Gossypium barbadense]|nr:hypothetical protein GOBAR_DD23513 [Gossypium barbadense]
MVPVQNEFLKVEEEIILPNKQLFPAPITSDDFFWAFGILRSRAFSRLRGQNLVLIPLADLINHSPNITTEDYAWEIKGAGLFSRDLLFSLRRANEELICRVVRDACKSALSGYHTTIEEDEKLMEDENLDSRLKIAVGIRAGEKKVLQQIDEIFKGRESELDELEYYQERRLKDLGLVGEQGEIIFWETN